MKILVQPAITRFQGEFRWLSNFWPARVSYGGLEYPTVEHAYQAAKSSEPTYRQSILRAKTPGEAKRLGRKITPWANWEEHKILVMRNLLRQKFSDPLLRDKLIATGGQIIQEGNEWGDEFWGINLHTGRGANNLGKLLMGLRRELQGVKDEL